MRGTFVYGDRTPPAGVAIPDAVTVTRHKRIFSTETGLEEGDNAAAIALKGDEASVYFSRPGAAHGSPAELWAMRKLGSTADGDPVPAAVETLLADIDGLNLAGLCPGDIPATAITFSVWEKRYPKGDPEDSIRIVFDNIIHGGFALMDLSALHSMLELKRSNRTAYLRQLTVLLQDLATTDVIKPDA
jgi:hypothetical protein